MMRDLLSAIDQAIRGVIGGRAIAIVTLFRNVPRTVKRFAYDWIKWLLCDGTLQFE